MSHDNGRPSSRGRRIPVNDLEAAQNDWFQAREQSLPCPEPETARSAAPAEHRGGGEGGAAPPSAASGAVDPSDQTERSDRSDRSDRSALAEVAALRARLAEVEDRWKRAAAELDNHRKQFNRQIEQLRRFDREAILRAWLDVVDDMERALCAQGASNNPWYEGMEAIHQRMVSVLAQFGVRPYVPQGEMFDPALHEAVATARLPGEPEGKIVEVVATGYQLDGAVLRPAKVVAVKHST